MPAGPAPRFPWLLPAAAATAALTAAAAALACTNPGPAEFEAFAGEQLAEHLSRELCLGGGLPLTVQLLLRDCPALVRQQQAVLGRLAAAGTQRINAGLFSVYVSEIGGQSVVPGLQLPRLRAITLAGAGQLTVLQTSNDSQRQDL